MKTIISTIMASIITYSALGQIKTTGKIIQNDEKLSELVSLDAKLEILGEGFEWAEGPVWVKDGGYLLFSDVPTNIIHKWKEGEKITEFLKPSGYTGIMPYSHESGSNGLTLSNDGQLIACEHGDRRVSIMPISGMGGKYSLADNYQGKRFNSPNDVVQSKSGHVYFTDPPYGLPSFITDPSREIDLFGVYRVSPERKVFLEVASAFEDAFSP